MTPSDFRFWYVATGLAGASSDAIGVTADIRPELEARFANMPPCLIGMEASVGAHHLSRKLKALGHDARLMPAKYVRPYSKGQENDFRDAEAIAEAVQRPTMKFVATKTAERSDLGEVAMHGHFSDLTTPALPPGAVGRPSRSIGTDLKLSPRRGGRTGPNFQMENRPTIGMGRKLLRPKPGVPAGGYRRESI